MPGPRSVDVTLARRAKVEALELRGATAPAIARELGADLRTVQRDLRWLATRRGADLDVPAARLRLLDAAQLVEVESWRLHQKLPAMDTNGRLGCLGKILAAQERQATLVGSIETATLAAEVAVLREQVAALASERGAVRRVSA